MKIRNIHKSFNFINVEKNDVPNARNKIVARIINIGICRFFAYRRNGQCRLGVRTCRSFKSENLARRRIVHDICLNGVSVGLSVCKCRPILRFRLIRNLRNLRSFRPRCCWAQKRPARLKPHCPPSPLLLLLLRQTRSRRTPNLSESPPPSATIFFEA